MHDERWAVMSTEECTTLLGEQHVGRIALADGDLPLILPVTFILDGSEVVFRTDPGSMRDAAPRSAPVVFEIDGIDRLNRTGWSVLVRGCVEQVTDPDELERLRQLVPWAPGSRPHFVRIRPWSSRVGGSGRRACRRTTGAGRTAATTFDRDDR